MRTRGLLRASAVYAVAPQAGRFANLLLLPFITPHLSASDYGYFALLVASMGLLEGMKELGLSVVLTNSYFKRPSSYKATWTRVRAFLQVWSLALSIIAGGLLFTFYPDEQMSISDRVAVVSALVLSSVTLSSASLMGILHLQYQYRVGTIARVTAVSALAGTFTTYLMIVEWGFGYAAFAYSSLVSALLGYLFYRRAVREVTAARSAFPRGRWIRAALKISVPLVPHFYANYILTLSDRLVFGLNGLSASSIGMYGFSSNLGSNFSILGKSVAKAATPVLMRAHRNGDQRFVRDVSSALQYVFLGAAFVAAIWLKEIFELLVRNKELSGSYVYAIPIVFAHALYPTYFAAVSLLRYRGATNALWRISGMAALLCLLLNLVTVPFFEIEVAGFISLIAFVYMTFSGFAVPEFRAHNNQVYSHARVLLLVAVSLAAAWTFKDASLPAKALLTVVGAAVAGLGAYRAWPRG